MNRPARFAVFLLSLFCLGFGLFLAVSHPLQPVIAAGAFLGCGLLFVRWPRLGILALPAFLPVLNFSPWTGWLVFEEFDLLVLAVLAAGYFRLWRDACWPGETRPFLLLLTLAVLLVARGMSGLEMPEASLFSAYLSPLNGLRVGKSLLWTGLLLPLLVEAGKSLAPDRALTFFFKAVLLGCLWVVLAVFWERAFYPGLLDISTPYRTVGTFWEMHHGGAALDAYLVLVAPLFAWAWGRTVSSTGRLLLGAFILAFVYACLTTFSRGVLCAVAGSLLILGFLRAWPCRNWRFAIRVRPSGVLLLVLVAAEILLLLGPDSFMNRRLLESGRDFGGRMEHWTRGVTALKTPADWLFGIGLGRLPERLLEGPSGRALPGSFRVQVAGENGEAGRPVLRLSGPSGSGSTAELGSLYALSQRVDLLAGQRYRFSMRVRSEGHAHVLVRVCALHLLFPARCQDGMFRLEPGERQLQDVPLDGAVFPVEGWQKAGHGVFLMSVLTPGGRVEVADVQLFAGGGNLLRNAQFLEREAGWFPQSFYYFLPWHIDNLYLELLIETGLAGLLLFLAVCAGLAWRLYRMCVRGETLSPVLLSSVGGLLSLGLVVSVLDMPRVAMLSGLFLVCAWRYRKENDNGQNLSALQEYEKQEIPPGGWRKSGL